MDIDLGKYKFDQVYKFTDCGVIGEGRFQKTIGRDSEGEFYHLIVVDNGNQFYPILVTESRMLPDEAAELNQILNEPCVLKSILHEKIMAWHLKHKTP